MAMPMGLKMAGQILLGRESAVRIAKAKPMVPCLCLETKLEL